MSSDNNEFASTTNPTQSRRTQHLAMFKMSLHCVSNMQEERIAKQKSSKASGIRIKSNCGRVEIASLWKNQRRYSGNTLAGVFCNDFELFLTSLELYEVFCAASSATTIALISLCRSAHCSDLSKSYSMRAASGARILPFCNCGSSN